MVTIQNKPPKEINYGDYPLPEFDNYSDYWSTSTSGKDIFPYGKGLADFTNRNFFTPGSELGNSIYDYPVNDPNQYGTKPDFVKHFDGVTEITYYQGTLEDYLYPEQSVGNVSLISESVFHDDFNDSDGEYRYELDKNVYDDMAEHTIPRAVSYSAGFIDYFFRGKLQILDAVETLINNQRKIKKS